MRVVMVFCVVLTLSLSLQGLQVKITHGVSTHQNKRPYQEDRFTYKQGSKGQQFFGIYDGHGGSATASYLQHNFHRYFSKCLSEKLKLFEIAPMQQVFLCAFSRIEIHVLNKYNDGSTAAIAYVNKHKENNQEYDYMHCAWVGDTRIVLESNGGVDFATQDHKPDREDEKKRIEFAGGKIHFNGVWRINGLAVSRSIGDKRLKMMGQKQIIAIPEYVKIPLNENNHFMIIASDGLWDVMSNEEVVKMTHEALRREQSLNRIAKMLQDKAITNGSGDNITICVVKFDWYPKSMAVRFWDWLWS